MKPDPIVFDTNRPWQFLHMSVAYADGVWSVTLLLKDNATGKQLNIECNGARQIELKGWPIPGAVFHDLVVYDVSARQLEGIRRTLVDLDSECIRVECADVVLTDQ